MNVLHINCLFDLNGLHMRKYSSCENVSFKDRIFKHGTCHWRLSSFFSTCHLVHVEGPSDMKKNVAQK